MRPFFSIIIPTYNRCLMVKKSIESIINQTFNNWECIVVNDGSTDETQIEVEKICHLDNRVKLINQINSERAIARNKGAQNANGQYYIFLDSDDYFGPGHLENIFNEINQNTEPHEMYFTNGTIVHNSKEELIEKEPIPESLPIDFFLNHSVVPARVCLHASIFDQFEFDPRTIIVEDTVLWTEILATKKIKYLPINSVFYNLHENNSVNIQKNNAYLKRLKGLKVLFNKKSVGKQISKSIKKKHLNRCYLGIAEFYEIKKNEWKSIYWIIKSILFFPNLDLKHKLVKILFLSKFAFSRN